MNSENGESRAISRAQAERVGEGLKPSPQALGKGTSSTIKTPQAMASHGPADFGRLSGLLSSVSDVACLSTCDCILGADMQ